MVTNRISAEGKALSPAEETELAKHESIIADGMPDFKRVMYELDLHEANGGSIDSIVPPEILEKVKAFRSEFRIELNN